MIPERELYEAYFQKNAEYYIQRVEFYDDGHRFTFNPYAFFLAIFWLLYRKMYIETFALVLFISAETIAEDFVSESFGYNPDGLQGAHIIINIAIGSLVGGLANFLYIKKTKRTIAKALNVGVSDEQVLAYLKSNGGVDYWRWVVGLFLLLSVNLLVYMLIFPKL